MGNLKILIADDHEIIRKGIRSILSERPSWEIVGEAETGTQALEKIKSLKPDIAILDFNMPVLNGLDVTREISKQEHPCKVLVLTMHESEQMIREVIASGARGFVLKSDSARELVKAIEAIVNKRSYFTSNVNQMILGGGFPDDRKNDIQVRRLKLTARQIEITRLLAEGKSTKDAAKALGISVKTVETHRANIMRRLELHGTTALVRYAVRNGIVQA